MPGEALRDWVARALPIARFQDWARRARLRRSAAPDRGHLLRARAVPVLRAVLHDEVGAVMVVRDLRADLYASVAYQSARFFQAHPRARSCRGSSATSRGSSASSTDVLADSCASSPWCRSCWCWRSCRTGAGAGGDGRPSRSWPTRWCGWGAGSGAASTRAQESIALAAGLLTESVAGAASCRASAWSGSRSAASARRWNGCCAADLKAARATALAPAVMELVGAAAGAGVFYLAGRRIAARHARRRATSSSSWWGSRSCFMSVRRLNQLNAELQHGAGGGRAASSP